MDMALRGSEPHLVTSLLRVVQQDSATTSEDVMQVAAYLRAMSLNIADVAWQHREGLLDDQALNGAVVPFRQALPFPGYHAVWRIARIGVAPEMASLIDRLVNVDTLPSNPAFDIAVAWRAMLTQIPSQATPSK